MTHPPLPVRPRARSSSRLAPPCSSPCRCCTGECSASVCCAGWGCGGGPSSDTRRPHPACCIAPIPPARCRHAAVMSGTGTRPQSSGPTAGRTACPGRAATLCEAGRPRLTPLVAIPTLRLLPTHCPLQRLPALLARPAQLHRLAVRAARGARNSRRPHPGALMRGGEGIEARAMPAPRSGRRCCRCSALNGRRAPSSSTSPSSS